MSLKIGKEDSQVWAFGWMKNVRSTIIVGPLLVKVKL